MNTRYPHDRSPGGLAANGNASLSPAEFLVRRLDERWNAFATQRSNCERGDISAVHDLRVAIRRLITAIDFIEAITSNRTTREIRKKLKKQLKGLSALRDAQVWREIVERLCKANPGLQMYLRRLRRSEQRLGSRVPRFAEKPKNGAVRGAVRKLRKACMRTFGSFDGGKRLNAAAMQTLKKSYARARARRTAIRPDDVATLHKARIAFKHYRYLLELFDGLLPAVASKQLVRARRIQTHMGDAHDLEMLLDDMNTVAWKGKAAHTAYAGARKILRARRLRAIEAMTKRLMEFDAAANY